MPRHTFRYHEFTATRATCALLLLGATGVVGCAQQSTVTSAWQGGATRGPAFGKVLVVGISPDLRQRCSFERALAYQIRTDATQAIASCDALTKKEPLTRELVEEAVASQQAEAVVATILVSKEWEVKEGGSRDTRGGGMYKATDAGYATGYYGVYGVPVVYGEFQTAPSLLTMTGDVEVTSNVYETRGATLIYTLTTRTRDIETRDAGLGEVTSQIAERLLRDGLTR